MEKTFVELFPKRLYEYMVKYNITQRDLAQKVGVSEASVSNWIKGIKIPRTDKIDKICKIFDCSYSDLISEPSDTIEADIYIEKLQGILENATPEQKDQILKVAEALVSK